MVESVRILMSSVVDYAGLFPPASLELRATLEKWRAHASSPEAWMLGRLIVPVSQLKAFAALIRETGGVPGPGAEPWRVSCLLSDELDKDVDRVFEFNRSFAPVIPADPDEPRHPLLGKPPTLSDSGSLDLPDEVVASGGVVIDAVEFKASSARKIDEAMNIIPEQLEPYIEIPASGGVDVRGLVAAMAGTGARAKIRTGGVTAEAFPSAAEVARFILACSAADVAFKATAGLHHALRGSYALTYEPGCPRGTMFGFLNVFVAAALVRSGSVSARGGEGDVVAVLEDTNARNFVFTESGVTWRDRRVDTPRLARVRETFATSFGSCSFDEPVAELRSMNLI
ncbi:MAG: hypothetical protein SFZ24_01760 [Planctomycetota bacterium]|nr:hypothetical protein [Planctomycetota bacterium]